MAQPPAHRTGARATRAISLALEPTDRVEPTPTNLPPHYSLAPIQPPPFAGTLDASLDAILDFSRTRPQLTLLTDLLLRKADTSTNWKELFDLVLDKALNGRALLEDLLFLVTHTLLPAQVLENRRLMYDAYANVKNLSGRCVLRYDMLREWQRRNATSFAVVEGRPAEEVNVSPLVGVRDQRYPDRRPLMQNIVPTLIAPPVGGYGTAKLKEAMKHHVTGLDKYLLLTDGEVVAWGRRRLVLMLAAVVLHWQWLRENTTLLADMDVGQWECLGGKADENAWVRDSR